MTSSARQPRSSRLAAFGAVVALAGGVLAGCGTAQPTTPTSVAASAGASATPSAPATPSASGRPSPSAAPSVSATPSAQQWLHDVTAVLHGGDAYLDAHRGARKPAIVLDIDNTALESFYGAGAATPPVLAFERHAVADGYAVLFATGRSPRSTGTRAHLQRAGYRVDALCTRPSTSVLLQVAKAHCREGWAAEGYTIIATVGNRPTDFEGGDVGRTYVLPDYGFLD